MVQHGTRDRKGNRHAQAPAPARPTAAAAELRRWIGDVRGADFDAETVGLMAAVLLRDGPSWVELRTRYPELEGVSILDPIAVVRRVLDAPPY